MTDRKLQCSVEDNESLRQELITTACQMNAQGINVNKSGNVSVRCQRGFQTGFLITPTGISYEKLKSDDLVFVCLGSYSPRFIGQRLPSSEWRLHYDLYEVNQEFGAIVHTHSCFATVLACLDEGIPAFHYMIALAGGKDIRCAPYATFGTDELSKVCLKAMENRRACLLSHHGVVAGGSCLSTAFSLAVEVENLARMWVEIRKIGQAKLIDKNEMDIILEKFRKYGSQKVDVHE